MGLPANFDCSPKPVSWQRQQGKAVILSGSCSAATRQQIEYHLGNHPGLKVDAAKVINGDQTPEQVAKWLSETDGLTMAYSSADPDEVKQIQDKFTGDVAATALEKFFGQTAILAVELGANRLLTAGGETSGAVVEHLKIATLEIGPEIDPGVPALRANDNLVIALKSGNFGSIDYFEKAALLLGSD